MLFPISSWDGFSVKRAFRGDIYNVTVHNPDHLQKGVKEIWVDGKVVDKILIAGDGKEHEVTVVMG